MSDLTNQINELFDGPQEPEQEPIVEEVAKKKSRSKTKKSTIKKPKIKSNNKSKDTKQKNIDKEKIIDKETKDNFTEIREIKSSTPIEVTQIDKNSSSEKPKKKGWWSK